MISIALFEPEIPPNTGNIARLCVGLDARLIIIGKPAFDLTEKAVKRAGLDYWIYLNLELYNDWESFLNESNIVHERIFLITKFGTVCYTDTTLKENDCFVFGKETKGLPDQIRSAIPQERHLFIPIPGPVRSLNLSNAVSIVAYEAHRQINY